MISVESLTKTFRQNNGRVYALDGVSLCVATGSVTGVVGPRGGGKSTLARCIALLERPDSGVIRVDGTDVTSLRGVALNLARQQIAVVPKRESLLRQRTAAGNVAEPLERAGVPLTRCRARVNELLDLVGLSTTANSPLDPLSAGELQRVAVARALATGPSVLVIDEPTAALTTEAADSVLHSLDRARAELGVTILIVTHDMDVVRKVCDDVVLLIGGKVMEHGKVLDLVMAAESRITAFLLPAIRENATAHSLFDVVADVVLVGFAAVGGLLPEACSRFGVTLDVIGGGFTRFAETPVARFRVGLTGERADLALDWISRAGGAVRRTPEGPPQISAA